MNGQLNVKNSVVYSVYRQQHTALPWYSANAGRRRHPFPTTTCISRYHKCQRISSNVRFFFGSIATTCPCRFRGPPSWAWCDMPRREDYGFWGWDTHEAKLRRPDDVSSDIGGCSARRALKPKFYQPTQTMVTAGILPFRENSHGIAGNRTRDLMISSQRLWPLDHEDGQECMDIRKQNSVHIFGP